MGTLAGVACLGAVVLGLPGLAQTEPEAAPAVQAPPWLATARQFLMVVFQAKADAVQALLPRGVKASVDDSGMARLALEVHAAERASGIPPYRTAFLVADVEGHSSRDGTPGHFALWGAVDSRHALAHFRQVYGFPYVLAERIALDMIEGRHRAVIQAGSLRAMHLEIESLADQAFAREGAVNMIGRDPRQGLVIGEVPYLSRGHAGKVVRFDLDAPGEPALAVLKGSAWVWSMVSTEQAFTYASRKSAATPAD